MGLEQELLGFLKGGRMITDHKDETLMRIKDSWEEQIHYSYESKSI